MTDKDHFDESYFGLSKFPLNNLDEENDLKSEDDDEDIKLVSFIKNYSPLFVVMGVFGAITVYLYTIINDINNIILNIGIISSLTIFVILGLSILMAYLEFGGRSFYAPISVVFDYLFMFSFIMLIAIVFFYIILNQQNGYYTLIAGTLFVLLILMLIMTYIKHGRQYGYFSSFVMYSLCNSFIVDILLLALILVTDYKQYKWLFDPALYAIGIVILLAIIDISANLLSAIRASIANSGKNIWKVLDEQFVTSAYEITIDFSKRLGGTVELDRLTYLIMLPGSISAMLIELICLYFLLSGIIKNFLYVILLILVMPIFVILICILVVFIVAFLYVAYKEILHHIDWKSS